MPSLTICPANFDIFVCQGDELPWSFTLKGSNGSAVDITGYIFTMDVDELENPNPATTTTQLFSLSGTISDAPNGVVEFALEALQAQTDVGRYYYKLYVTDADGHTYTAVVGRFIFVDSCETNTVSDVDICNLALGLIGDTARVTNISPPDTSTQAHLCSRFYPIALRATLEMHNWAFATRRSACSSVTPPEHDDGHEHTSTNFETCDCSEWKYYYQLPRHFLKAIAVYEENSESDYSESKEFSVQLDSTGVLRLYTNVENAVMLYTEYVVETHRFPPLFQAAVAWHLASLLAGPIIRGDAGSAEAKRCQQMMQLYLAKARQADSVNRSIKPANVASWMLNR
jgi:hypothetical protein